MAIAVVEQSSLEGVTEQRPSLLCLGTVTSFVQRRDRGAKRSVIERDLP
jgi:hypothetical protein